MNMAESEAPLNIAYFRLYTSQKFLKLVCLRWFLIVSSSSCSTSHRKLDDAPNRWRLRIQSQVHTFLFLFLPRSFSEAFSTFLATCLRQLQCPAAEDLPLFVWEADARDVFLLTKMTRAHSYRVHDNLYSVRAYSVRVYSDRVHSYHVNPPLLSSASRVSESRLKGERALQSSEQMV